MSDNIFSESNAQHLNFMRTVGSMVQGQTLDKAQQALASKLDSDADLKSEQTINTKAVAKALRKEKPLGERTNSVRKTESVLIRVEDKEAAEEFTQKHRHPEFASKDLVILKAKVLEIKPPITKEKILKVVGDKYSDPGMLDSALEFLEITNKGSPEILNAIKELRQENLEKNRESVISSRNIAPYAHIADKVVHIGTFQENIDLHIQVMTEAPQAAQLLTMLFEKYKTYDRVEHAVKFLNKSVGTTLRASEGTDTSKMSSIPPGELHALMAEVRTIRQITGIGKFIKGYRLELVQTKFDEAGITS